MGLASVFQSKGHSPTLECGGVKTKEKQKSWNSHCAFFHISILRRENALPLCREVVLPLEPHLHHPEACLLESQPPLGPGPCPRAPNSERADAAGQGTSPKTPGLSKQAPLSHCLILGTTSPPPRSLPGSYRPLAHPVVLVSVCFSMSDTAVP